MSEISIGRAQFLRALNEIAKGDASGEDLTCKLRKALLDFASETPDNVQCSERIEVGSKSETIGLKIRGQSVLLSDVAYALEDEPMPKGLRTALPDVTDADWDGFTRLTTLLYLLLSRSA